MWLQQPHHLEWGGGGGEGGDIILASQLPGKI